MAPKKPLQKIKGRPATGRGEYLRAYMNKSRLQAFDKICRRKKMDRPDMLNQVIDDFIEANP